MQLLSCHIVNFGGLSDREYTFGKGITQFCGRNGAGKTTLADFIKAMFYGLPAYTSRSKFNSRIRYYPFGGGKFGGNLTFAMGGKTYRIERFFDKRSEAGDEVKVFIDGTPTAQFDKKVLGEAIFGLDEASFTRTVFVTSEQIEMCSTGGINAKLNNYVDATDGETDYDGAITALDKAAKTLKMRGGKGKIAEQEERISALKAGITDAQRITEGLKDKYAESRRLTQDIERLEESQRQRNAANLERQRWEQYDYILSNIKAAGDEREKLNVKYPCGIPTREQIAALAANAETEAELTGRLNAAAADERDVNEFEELKETFANGLPDRAALDEVKAKTTQLQTIQGDISRGQAASPTPRQAELNAKFSGKEPADADMQRLRQHVEQYKKLQSECLASDGQTAPAKSNRAVPYVLYALAAAATVAGVILLALSQTVVGAVALAVGPVAAGVGAAVQFKSGKAPSAPSGRAVRQAEMNGLQDEIRAFLVPYCVYSADGVVYDFKKFEDDLADYRQGVADAAQAERTLNGLREREHALTDWLEAFYAPFRLNGDFDERYNLLRQKIADYTRLNAKLTADAANAEEWKSALRAVQNESSSLLAAYRLTRAEDVNGQIRELDRDCAAIARLAARERELTAQAEQFRRENGLTERPQGAPEQTDFAAALKAKRDALATLNREIADGEAEAEKLGERQNALENAQEQLQEYRDKYAVYTAATDALKRAEQSLKDKYIAPVREQFCRYSTPIERALGEKMSMDKDFRLTFERGGERRADGHLSSGQRTVCALCFRLALIDNMFEGEKPFIVMDDPFTELDGEHMEKTARLIKELAEGKQILYFCCHESRALDGAGQEL